MRSRRSDRADSTITLVYCCGDGCCLVTPPPPPPPPPPPTQPPSPRLASLLSPIRQSWNWLTNSRNIVQLHPINASPFSNLQLPLEAKCFAANSSVISLATRRPLFNVRFNDRFRIQLSVPTDVRDDWSTLVIHSRHLDPLLDVTALTIYATPAVVGGQALCRNLTVIVTRCKRGTSIAMQ